MSLNLDTKVTGHEVKVWLNNCLKSVGHDCDGEALMELLTEQQPPDFKAPRKARASKVSSSDRSQADYDCLLCDGRVWADSFGAQCSRKKKDGSCFCAIHLKESGKNDGTLRNGLITEDRPTNAFNDPAQTLLPWHDVEMPAKTKKSAKKTSGTKAPRKCSNCCEPGHNKKTCPHLKDDGAGTGLTKEVASVMDDLVTQIEVDSTEVLKESVIAEECDSESLKRLAKREPELEQELEQEPEPEPEPDQELTEDLSCDTDDEGDSEVITFEGVQYTFDSEEGTVHDDELDEIGTWDGSKITFINKDKQKLHNFSKRELKKED